MVALTLTDAEAGALLQSIGLGRPLVGPAATSIQSKLIARRAAPPAPAPSPAPAVPPDASPDAVRRLDDTLDDLLAGG